MAKQKQITNSKRNVSVRNRMEAFLNLNYKIRLNVVSGRVQLTKKPGNNFINIGDVQINSLHRELDKANIPCSMQMLRNTLNSDFSKKYNPFIDYITNTTKWDGQDYIEKITDTITTTSDDNWKKWFKKWFVAMVAGMVDDSKVNHTVIVFSGKQGIGKTTWMLNLVPNELKEYCYTGTLNLGNKDSVIYLSTCMLIMMDELESMNNSKIGELKELITKGHINVRKPYGHTSEMMIRRASFAAAINTREFITDTTGSRRFLCFEAIDIDYKCKIPLNEAYSQAYDLYQNGFKFWFDPTDNVDIENHNNQFRLQSLEEELLMTYYEPCYKHETDLHVSATDIIQLLKSMANVSLTNSSKIMIGRALKSNGFQRFKKNGNYVYALKEKVI